MPGNSRALVAAQFNVWTSTQSCFQCGPSLLLLHYLLSLSPGPLVRIQNEPAVACQTGDGWVCWLYTPVEKICLYRGSPPASWLQHHTFPCFMWSCPGFWRENEAQCSLPFSPASFISSTNSSIYFPFTASTYHFSLLLSPRALFFFCVFYHFKFLYFHFNEVLAVGRNEKYVLNLCLIRKLPDHYKYTHTKKVLKGCYSRYTKNIWLLI